MERRKPFCRKIAIYALTLALGTVTQAQYGGGSGTPNDPYLISTPERMNAIGADPNDWDKHFKLMADIDLAQYTGTEFNLIGMSSCRGRGCSWTPFTGVFDGNGHTISNFTCIRGDEGHVGLFRYIDDPNAQVRNLGLIAPRVDSRGDYTGSLVGELEAGVIVNCYVTGGAVTGDRWVGGVVGHGHTIAGCYANTVVRGRDHVGGLAGTAETIVNSYAQGTVIGNEYVGGLVGYDSWARNGTVTNCYATALVIGTSNRGGLIGCEVSPGWEYEDVVASFWDMETSLQTASAGGRGKRTTQMQTLGTFLAWGEGDNAGVWTIDEGGDYPRLAWENRPGLVIGRTGFADLFAGSGTEDDPYLIYTAAQLDLIGQFPDQLDRHYRLMADIDLSAYKGDEFHIIGGPWSNPFTGIFDGNGHAISNFTYVSPQRHACGLFGYVSGNNAEVKNLGLIGPTSHVEGGGCVGVLAGMVEQATIANCYVEGGTVSGWADTGGLVGCNVGGAIRECFSNAAVLAATWCYPGVGGLVGRNPGGTVRNCYATGLVVGDGAVGGLVGSNDEGTIANCYAIGRIVGSAYLGGLVGDSIWGTDASFWDTETTRQTTSAGGMGLTTVEMQTAAPFLEAGWDFVGEDENGVEEIWWIDEGQDYPRLWWESAEAEF